MPTSTTASSNVMILTTQQNGITVIPSSTPLARLNYFDGKFLRADDLKTEQQYIRDLIRFSNKSSGHGVAHGFSVTAGAGDQLNFSPGLAVNAEGQVILLTGATSVSLADLINKTNQSITPQLGSTGSGSFGDCTAVTAAPPSQVLETGDLYVITVAPAEALCGQEDVYGKLCEEACVTSTDRPLVIEGIVLRARPLVLSKPLPISSAFPFDQSHLRSRVASAVFAQEPTLIASLISAAGLASGAWCLGAQADSGNEVPLAVVDRASASIVFLDAWTVRREKIDTVAKRYWQWRMAMRPWDVYLAQILQFQCQLSDLLHDGPQGTGDDPCSSAKALVKEAATRFDEVTQFYSKVASKLASVNSEGLTGGLAMLSSFQSKLADFTKLLQSPAQDRRLLRGGIVELPSAGYLPVVPGSAATVNTQVRQWMGEGVDLRYCVVRPDYVPHAVEEVQHMERISLTQGLDDPQSMPQVDILVPNGQIIQQATASSGQGYEASVQVGPLGRSQGTSGTLQSLLNVQGASTTRRLPSGGGAVYMAGAAVAPTATVARGLAEGLIGLGTRIAPDFSKLNSKANTQPAASGAVGENAELFTRLNVSAAAALRASAARRAGNLPASVGYTPQVGALWIQLSSTNNPFTLALGDTTALALRIVVVLPGENTATVDYRLQGDLTINQPVTGGPTPTFGGFFAGSFVVDDQQNPTGGTLQLNIQASYDSSGNIVDVKFTPSPTFGTNSESSQTLQFEVKTGWQGDPQNVVTRLIYRTFRDGQIQRQSDLLDSTLTRNDKVLEAGQPSHTAALSALDVIGGALLKEPSFADSAGRLLFPPPPPPTSDLLVSATLDWVLFQRRRTKTCATETVSAVVNARRYQVQHLRVPIAETARSIVAALLNNDSPALQKAGFKAVDVVEFAAGTPVLNTPLSAIQADWSALSASAGQVYYSAIVSQGAATADGSSLSLQRLGRFQDAISAITPPRADVKYETLPVFPAALPASGLDGDIVVITLPTPQFTTHRVLRPKSGTDVTLDEVIADIQKNGVAQAISDQSVDDLGSVRFEQHTSSGNVDDLTAVNTAWAADGAGTVAALVTLFDSTNPSETQDTLLAQSQAIGSTIGTDLASKPQDLANSPAPLTQPVTIVQGQTAVPPDVPVPQPANRTASLLIWHPDAAGAGRVLWPMSSPVTLDFKPDGALVNKLTAAQVKILRKGTAVRLMEFFTREGTPDANAKVRFKTLSAELDAKGFTLSSVKTGPLPAALNSVVPADAASSQDIVFLEMIAG